MQARKEAEQTRRADALARRPGKHTRGGRGGDASCMHAARPVISRRVEESFRVLVRVRPIPLLPLPQSIWARQFREPVVFSR